MNLKAIKRAIILCWVMLFVCFAIKLFGGNWFEIICTNQSFIRFCDFIENTTVLYQVLSLLIYVIPTFFIFINIAQLPKPNKIQCLTTVLLLIIIWLSKFINYGLKSILEIICFLTIPIILRVINKESFVCTIKTKWYYGVFGAIISILFVAISMITRNLGLNTIIKDNLVISFIMLIDYYIMIALYYFYIKLKRG